MSKRLVRANFHFTIFVTFYFIVSVNSETTYAVRSPIYRNCNKVYLIKCSNKINPLHIQCPIKWLILQVMTQTRYMFIYYVRLFI